MHILYSKLRGKKNELRSKNIQCYQWEMIFSSVLFASFATFILMFHSFSIHFIQILFTLLEFILFIAGCHPRDLPQVLWRLPNSDNLLCA